MWESGADRIADLELLPEISNTAKLSMLKKKPKDLGNKEVKYVELHDEWNTYKVTFSVFHPFTNSDDQMHISADHPSLGGDDEENEVLF
jgi:hypothetical protein